MAPDRGKRIPEPLPTEGDEDGPVLAELARRAMALGLSGFFFTESTIRKALGETLPQEWTDFAADQSERTRKELLERLTQELGRTLDRVDVAAVLAELMQGRSLEIQARIRIVDDDDDGDSGAGLRLRLRDD